MDLATSQWTLLKFGVPIRGGATVGDISTGEGRAFGPAFVRAYRPDRRRFDDNTLVLPKYLWTVRYHKASAKRLLPHRRELKITVGSVPASDEFLKPRRRG